MKNWLENWPEDAKTGVKFVQELMRRYPDRVQIGNIEQARQWSEKEEQSAPTPTPPSPPSPAPSSTPPSKFGRIESNREA